MQKEASWLLSELSGLVTNGVVDQATAERLRSHYAKGSDSSGLSWGMILLATGGAALIGLGVLLLFAHNWENWTPEVRVGFSLLPLVIGQVACLFALRNGSRVWSEAAGAFTTIAIGASIALIAQTYQFGGDLPRFLLTWLLLALPLVYLLDASAVASLCWMLATGWVMASDDGWLRSFDSLENALRLPVFLALFCLPLPHLIRHIRLDRGGPRVSWMLRVALIAAVIGVFIGGDLKERDLFMIFAGMAAAAVLTGQRYFFGMRGLWGNPLSTAGHVGIFIIALVLTSDDLLKELNEPLSSNTFLAVAFGIAALWLSWNLFSRDKWLVALPIGALTPLAFILPIIGQTSMTVAIVLAHLFALALAAALIRTGLRHSQLGLANEGVALIAALILWRFFDSDLSYVVRGLGFIITGVGFFAAVFWLRRHVREATS